MKIRAFRTALSLVALMVVVVAPSARADAITYQLTMPNIGSGVPITSYSFTSSTFTFTVLDSNPAALNLQTMFDNIQQGRCSGISCRVASSDVFTFDNSQLSLTDTFTDSFLSRLVGSPLGNQPPTETATFDYISMTETPANPTGNPGTVPEPSSLLLLGSGLTVIACGVRRKLRL